MTNENLEKGIQLERAIWDHRILKQEFETGYLHTTLRLSNWFRASGNSDHARDERQKVLDAILASIKEPLNEAAIQIAKILQAKEDELAKEFENL